MSVTARGGVAAGWRAWDRWLNRHVDVKILPSLTIDGLEAKQRFIRSARALTRIDEPHVGSLLDYGATENGAPYHVMCTHSGLDLATLLSEDGRMAWARVESIVLGLIAGVEALHRRHVVHGEVALHNVVLADDGTATLVDLTEATLLDGPPTPEDLREDVHGVAVVGFSLLTGFGPLGRSPAALEAALAQTDAPARVRMALLSVLAGHPAYRPADMPTLRRAFTAGARRSLPRSRSRLSSALATAAAAAMLGIGLAAMGDTLERPDWTHQSYESPLALTSGTIDRCVFEGTGGKALAQLTTNEGAEPTPSEALASEALASEVSLAATLPRRQISAGFVDGRARVEVGSDAASSPLEHQVERIDLYRELSPALLVERGIDLTHGRPTPADDPRAPVVDGPERARAMFAAACERDFGKGCHMLGVQIAEGMIVDADDPDPAAHYRRGCELDYARSCGLLAELARAGSVPDEPGLLEAKACLLAGPGSRYCALDGRE
jgi:TPR repeat protein